MLFKIAAMDIHQKVRMVVVPSMAGEVADTTEPQWSWRAGGLEPGLGSGTIW
jgi:hypothetical protein